jgi:hypothetical protein
MRVQVSEAELGFRQSPRQPMDRFGVRVDAGIALEVEIEVRDRAGEPHAATKIQQSTVREMRPP